MLCHFLVILKHKNNKKYFGNSCQLPKHMLRMLEDTQTSMDTESEQNLLLCFVTSWPTPPCFAGIAFSAPHCQYGFSCIRVMLRQAQLPLMMSLSKQTVEHLPLVYPHFACEGEGNQQATPTMKYSWLCIQCKASSTASLTLLYSGVRGIHRSQGNS